MKNIISLLIFFAALCISCTSTQEVKFDKLGISFICPSDWKITDEENFNNVGYYLSCEKNGFNSSGLITISWVNDTTDLTETINKNINQFKNTSVYKNSNLSFGEELKAKFGRFESKSVEFSVSLIGVKHKGVIHCFWACGKTFTIVKQEAIEDEQKNKNGFTVIENNFSCK